MLQCDRLQSDLVTLQKYSLEDLDELFEAISVSTERVYPWLPWCHPNYTIAETEAWLKIRPQRWHEGEEFGFTIRHQGKIVGVVALVFAPNLGLVTWVTG